MPKMQCVETYIDDDDDADTDAPIEIDTDDTIPQPIEHNNKKKKFRAQGKSFSLTYPQCIFSLGQVFQLLKKK